MTWRDAIGVALSRLSANRWLLAAAIAAVLAMYWLDGIRGSQVAGIVAGLVLAAALAPASSGGRFRDTTSATTGGSGLNGLSGETLAAAVADPLVIVDGSGLVVLANTAATSAFGTIGPGVSVLLKFRTPEMLACIQDVLQARSQSRVADYVERVPVERVFRATVSRVGRGTGLYILVFRDQSETRRIDRMRADFIANASHELRTPLASIAGFVETLRGPAKNDAKARDHFLQIMQNQTSRMARLIDDLLSLSRLEMKAHLPPAGTVDIAAVVNAVVDTLNPLVQDSGVAIEKTFENQPFGVRGDRDELFQVFENLLENACKYGQSGGRVTVSIQRGGDAARPEVEVTIRDFGPGIAEEHIPRITERFYRVDVETSRSQKGTGLGLAIVKHILTRHDARLTVKSKLGEGAAFTVSLPAT